MTTEKPDPLLDDPEPPQPRAPGKVSHVENEDKLVEQIARDDENDAIDELYNEESAPEEPMLVTGEQKHKFLAKLKRPKFWILLFLFLLAGLALAWLITPSRWWMLNTVGLKAQLDIATVVAADGPPPMLKNATVTINNRDYHTDDNGKLVVALPYGPLHIVVTKPGYQPVTKDQTLDFDPFFHYLGGKQIDAAVRNQLFTMKNVGVVVSLVAKDWLTGDPITEGTFSLGDVAAQPDPEGKVSLTIPATDAKTVQLTATFKSTYANRGVDVAVGDTKQEVLFTPAGKHYFISKRSGQFVVYGSNLDGSEVAEVVPGSTSETGDIAFSASPSGKFGVLGSTREATRDSFGSVQQKLYSVDLATNKLSAADTAQRFALVDWSGDTLVYVATYRTAGGQLEQRLASLDVTTGKQTVLATATTFKLVRVRLGSALYQRSDNELRTVKIKGGGDKSLGTDVQKITQSSADVFAYQVADLSWHSYDANADQVATATTPTSLDRAFLASASADGQTQLVSDVVDGKRTLLAKKVGNGQETKLFVGDLAAPVGFVGNVAVYRSESADYVVSLNGGTPKKITDVTPIPNTNGYFTFN